MVAHEHSRSHGRTRWRRAIALAVAACCWLVSGTATAATTAPDVFNSTGIVVDHAAGRMYWLDGSSVAFASLDGTGAGRFDATGATFEVPNGLVLDPVDQRLYWVNVFGAQHGLPTIGYVKLDGSGGGNLPTAGAPNLESEGLAIDLAGRRLIWGNGDGAMSFAMLNGQGGGQLNVPGGVGHPMGIAIDPAGGRIYWGTIVTSTIQSARLLDGSDPTALPTTGATLDYPTQMAIDLAGGRIFWIDALADPVSISFARLDGTGGGDLHVSGVAVTSPHGLAIDPVSGRLYWGDNALHAIVSANLDGSDAKIVYQRPQSPPVDPSLRAPAIDDAPPGSTPLTDASLLYHAVDAGVALRCELDGGAAVTCGGHSSYANLALGRHCFSVREQRNGAVGPAAEACWTVTALAAGCTASFHHGYFIAAGAVRLAGRTVVFHATTDGAAGRIALSTRSAARIRVSYRLDGTPVTGGARGALAYAQLDRTRSHTLTVDVASGKRHARIVRSFRYASFVAIACGGRRVVGRIPARTVAVGGGRVTIRASVPREIRGTAKLRFLVSANRAGVLRAVRFAFAGKRLDQHALSAALTARQLAADGTQTIAIQLVPTRGRTVTVRIPFRTHST